MDLKKNAICVEKNVSTIVETNNLLITYFVCSLGINAATGRERKATTSQKKIGIVQPSKPGGTYQWPAILNEQIASMSKLAQIMRLIKKTFPFATS